MGNNTTLSRREAIRQDQNLLLYSGLRFSALGTFAAATVAVYTFGPLSDPDQAWVWFLLIVSVYLCRVIDSICFNKDQEKRERPAYWQRRFNIGAVLSSLAWSSSMWMIFPQNNPAYQVLLVLTLGGVAGGALASLPYDKFLNNTFQTILLLSVEVRLLIEGTTFSMQVALFSLFVFGFLLSCGKQVSKNYYDLLSLRQDSEENSLALINTTERMARLGYWQWDRTSDWIELSENLANLWGFKNRKIRFKVCLKHMHPKDRRRVRHMIDTVSASQDQASVEYRMRHPVSGEYRDMNQVTKHISDSHGNTYLLGTVQDITEIKSAEQRIFTMAYYDELTGLANRAHFHEHLKQEIFRSKRKNEKFAIVYIDLDDFKDVNDSYGHECGDKYLRVLANHLTAIVRRSDVVARLGGDEFCLILHDIENPQYILRIVDACLEITRELIEIGNHRLRAKLSIGISIFPEDGEDSDTLLRNADLAMYTVKQNGKHGYRFYRPHMVTDNLERMKLEADLRHALDNDEFELWYQPKIFLPDRSLYGVEALIRWRHSSKGLISPAVFINTAERVGMIKEIGEWVIETACAQLHAWNRQGFSPQVAINISPDHFTSSGFPLFIKKTLNNYKLNARDIEIEITESLSRDPTEHTRICHELRQSGLRIAVDDFGTGYSSLSVLADLEVDTLKIDKSFIDGLPHDQSSKLIVKSIVDMSLGLGYDIVAEGVETTEQLNFLESLNCPYVQGYYFSKPVLAQELLPLLSASLPLKNSA